MTVRRGDVISTVHHKKTTVIYANDNLILGYYNRYGDGAKADASKCIDCTCGGNNRLIHRSPNSGFNKITCLSCQSTIELPGYLAKAMQDWWDDEKTLEEMLVLFKVFEASNTKANHEVNLDGMNFLDAVQTVVDNLEDN